MILAHDGRNSCDRFEVRHGRDGENSKTQLTFPVEVNGDQIRLGFRLRVGRQLRIGGLCTGFGPIDAILQMTDCHNRIFRYPSDGLRIWDDSGVPWWYTEQQLLRVNVPEMNVSIVQSS